MVMARDLSLSNDGKYFAILSSSESLPSSMSI